MEKKRRIKHYRDLDVYHKAFTVAMKIYEITKSFPKEEKYSLVDQIRRSSRSVCSNLAEAWRKRKYIAAFRNKLTDAMQEASETQSWLEFCLACKYIGRDIFEEIDREYEEILSMLNSVEKNAEKFCF
ncbi:MAG: four helix bundle protein [Nitrospirae bacterium]|nr:four helix bundle protein [Nitrospirota bacterium]